MTELVGEYVKLLTYKGAKYTYNITNVNFSIPPTTGMNARSFREFSLRKENKDLSVAVYNHFRSSEMDTTTSIRYIVFSFGDYDIELRNANEYKISHYEVEIEMEQDNIILPLKLRPNTSRRILTIIV